MKFMMFTYIPRGKMAEVSAASDSVVAKTPKEKRTGGPYYLLMCHPLDVPADCAVTVSTFDSDSVEEMAANVYPVELAGASIQIIPVLEVQPGGSVKTEKKYRG